MNTTDKKKLNIEMSRAVALRVVFLLVMDVCVIAVAKFMAGDRSGYRAYSGRVCCFQAVYESLGIRGRIGMREYICCGIYCCCAEYRYEQGMRDMDVQELLCDVVHADVFWGVRREVLLQVPEMDEGSE